MLSVHFHPYQTVELMLKNHLQHPIYSILKEYDKKIAACELSIEEFNINNNTSSKNCLLQPQM